MVRCIIVIVQVWFEKVGMWSCSQCMDLDLVTNLDLLLMRSSSDALRNAREARDPFQTDEAPDVRVNGTDPVFISWDLPNKYCNWCTTTSSVDYRLCRRAAACENDSQ
jgi:hypothetical protein